MEPLNAPVKVSIDLTYRCPLRCRHRRADTGMAPNSSGDELRLDDIRAVLEDLGRMGVFRVAFSGGEPFLRPDIVKILGHAANVGVGRAFVSTSGMALDDRKGHALRSLRCGSHARAVFAVLA